VPKLPRYLPTILPPKPLTESEPCGSANFQRSTTFNRAKNAIFCNLKQNHTTRSRIPAFKQPSIQNDTRKMAIIFIAAYAFQMRLVAIISSKNGLFRA
jgi:hypothetical protein